MSLGGNNRIEKSVCGYYLNDLGRYILPSSSLLTRIKTYISIRLLKIFRIFFGKRVNKNVITYALEQRGFYKYDYMALMILLNKVRFQHRIELELIVGEIL